jgi:hypothetical protein
MVIGPMLGAAKEYAEVMAQAKRARQPSRHARDLGEQARLDESPNSPSPDVTINLGDPRRPLRWPLIPTLKDRRPDQYERSQR